MMQELINEVDKDGNGEIDFFEFVAVLVKERAENQSKDEIMAVFRTLDERGCGYLTPDELRHIMRNLGEPLEEKEIDDIIREVDSDGNGEIDFEEFCSIMIPSAKVG